ncbi:MAG: T9SS type A sorting domain-containing protein [Bacteroidia bacterium]|nr:T9SS type A sorting domain-containing protein [Bacteroidia bacterium]
MKRFLSPIQTLAVCALFATAVQLHAQNGGTAVNNGPSTNVLFPPTVGLTQMESYEIQGDYIAAGVGMRNVGSGTINLSIPAGATLRKAYLFWAIIWDTTPPSATGELNSTPISGALLGSSGSPCWGGTAINFYAADVTNEAVSGVNNLSGFPSGLTDNSAPIGNATFPLLEGATLVLVFSHPLWDYNTISIYTGANTFSLEPSILYNVGTYTGRDAGNPADQLAQHTYIVADGQARFLGDGTAFNGTPTSGPTTAVKTGDAFDGEDGIVPVSATDGLWDTHTLDVSSFFPHGVSTNAVPEASAGSGGDCITWGAHIISVKTALNAHVDVKPGSCPNSFNVQQKGNLPVAILGSAGFDVTDIDPATIMLNGVARSGGVSISDSAMPYGMFQMGCMDCNTGGADGFDDLVVHFNAQAVSATLGLVATNDCVPVEITGMFYDGTPFSGTDILRIINNSPKDSPNGIAGFALQLDQNSPNPIVEATSFSYTLPAEGFMQLAVYNALGQKIATVAQGVQPAGSHMVSWNGLSDNGARVAPGVYLYRLETGSQSISKKLLISK